MMDERYDNGVRVAYQPNRLDTWATEHRLRLDRRHYMSDIDQLLNVSGMNTANGLFVEYALPRTAPEQPTLLDCEPLCRHGIVALFGKKDTEAGLNSDSSKRSRHFYRWLCQLVGRHQPTRPKFIYVVGRGYPYKVFGCNVDTGQLFDAGHITQDNWTIMWKTLGLEKVRSELEHWLERPPLA